VVEKVPVKHIALLSFLLLCTSALADVLIDQIGPMDGGNVGALVTENQYFEAKFSEYDIAAIEKITVTESTTLTSIEFVLYGWNGFTDPSSITGFQANLYSSESDAGMSLVGNEGSQEIDPANITINSDWLGLGMLISASTDITIGVGDHWVSFIPRNPFATDGLTGVLSSLIGDGVMSVQANPSGAYGFGPWQELTHEVAIRIHNGDPNDPCDLSLPSSCPEDISENGIVDTSDLLEIIAQWGDCGDGTYRPTADIAPLPNGDCCVNLSDILAVIGEWDSDCNVYGACCLLNGICVEEASLDYCLDAGGYFAGIDSSCEGLSCDFGACCYDAQTCSDQSDAHCVSAGGTFEGVGTSCADYDCAALQIGDECDAALDAVLGPNAFDTSDMTPSSPIPDETFCEGTNLGWSKSNDVWFVFVPSQSHNHTFSLCDSNSYDTSMALYAGSCENQISCNGDSEDADPVCQQYYSSMDSYLTQGETYYIRIGGWLGEVGQGTLQISEIPLPVPGSCCFPLGNCVDDLIPEECAIFGGEFAGEGTLCSSDPCIFAVGDECADATQIYIGSNDFDTTAATASSPNPDESMCPETQLNWGTSPDVWMYWTAMTNGFVTFSTCDVDSYDTSMILYESSCENQVACNGDGQGDSDCQQYYSLIEYPVLGGTTYYIRMGGWQGSTGVGSVNVSFIDENDTGACCAGSGCNEAMTAAECDTLNGNWFNGEVCSDVDCTENPCSNSSTVQEPHIPGDVWFAGTSANDPKNNMIINRAELVMLDSVTSIRVWGFQLFYNKSGWNECDATIVFDLRAYEDVFGLPGTMTTESLNTPGIRIPTGEIYGGMYELSQWNMDFVAANVDHLGVQSVSTGAGCWFLWMSSGTGDSLSSVNSGSGWTLEPNDLSICVE